MMIKYSDVTGEGCEVRVVTGIFEGKTGIVKKACDGILKVSLPDGTEIEVDEMAVTISKEKA